MQVSLLSPKPLDIPCVLWYNGSRIETQTDCKEKTMIRRYRFRLSNALLTVAHRQWRKTCGDCFNPSLVAHLWSKVARLALRVSPWRWPPPAGDALIGRRRP